jgi:hypothetical protein
MTIPILRFAQIEVVKSPHSEHSNTRRNEIEAWFTESSVQLQTKSATRNYIDDLGIL